MDYALDKETGILTIHSAGDSHRLDAYMVSRQFLQNTVIGFGQSHGVDTTTTMGTLYRILAAIDHNNRRRT